MARTHRISVTEYRRLHVAVLGGVWLACVAVARAQAPAAGGFSWSWEKDKGPATEPAVSNDAPAPTSGSGFAWSWEQSVEAGSATPAPAPVPVPAPAAAPVSAPVVAPPVPAVTPSVTTPPAGPGGAAYQDLVSENLELRRRIEAASQSEAALRGENERLAAEMGDLEKRVAQSLTLIADLRRQTAGESDKARLRDLEQRVQSAEAERVKLTGELQGLRRQMEQRPAAPPPCAGDCLFRPCGPGRRAGAGLGSLPAHGA